MSRLTSRARLQARRVVAGYRRGGRRGAYGSRDRQSHGRTVIACAGSAEKLAIAQQYGADHLIDYSREDIRERVKAITGGRGADVVYDPVGGDAFDASLRSIAWGGRIIIIGFASGRIPQVPANILLVKNIDVIGFYWGSYSGAQPSADARLIHQAAALV